MTFLTADPSTAVRHDDPLTGYENVTFVCDTVDVLGYLHAEGNFKAQGRIDCANWVSGVSDDGFWINDANYASRRYKLYFDSSNGRLYARRDSSTYSYFNRSGGSSSI